MSNQHAERRARLAESSRAQPHFHPVDAENMHFTFGTKTPAEQPDTEIVGRVDTGHHRCLHSYINAAYLC